MGIANWTQIENTLQARIAIGLGVPGDRVRWGDTSRDGPATTGDHAVLRVGNITSLSPATPEQSVTDNPQAYPGGEILLNSLEPTEFELTITVYTSRTTGSFSAYARATSARASLHRESTTDALEAANVVVVQCEPVQSLPALLETEFQGKATFTALIRISDGDSEATTFIETLGIEYGSGPVFQMSGAQDVAGFANLERWARVNQPAFPRIVDGPQGRTGVQFSRLGADVLSGTARDPGHLRDLRTDPNRVINLIGGEISIGFWFRQDPLVVLSGVGTPSYRPFAITGTDGTLVAQSPFWGITYSITSGGYVLNTQTPSNLGGTGINGNVSTFVTPARLGTWEHITAVVRKNGLDSLPIEVGATVDWYRDGALAFTQVGVGGTLSVGPRIPQWSLFPAPRYVSVVGAGWSHSLTDFINGVDGSLSDLVIYPRALSASEVATLYTSGPFGFRT